MAPVWLAVAAWVYLPVCFCCAGIVAYDIAHRGQPMGVMNFVFPITALYFGPFALALYWRWGRAAARTAMASMSIGRAAVSQAAAAASAGGGGVRMHGGRSAYDEMAGAAGPDGAWGPVPPGERAGPWCCSFSGNDAQGGSAQVQSWLEARFLLSERELRDS